jgi:hypothetical protein
MKTKKLLWLGEQIIKKNIKNTIKNINENGIIKIKTKIIKPDLRDITGIK